MARRTPYLDRPTIRATPADLHKASNNTTRAAIEAGLEVTGKKSVWRQPRKPRVSKEITVTYGTPVPALSRDERRHRLLLESVR